MADPGEKPRMSDADMLARFKTSKKRPACSDTLGMDLAEVHQDEMRIVVNFTADKSFANPTGAVQGGFIAAMLDEAISTNIIIASNVTMTAPTLEMKTSYLAPLFVGPAKVEAKILKFGKSVCFSEARCFDPDGKLVATATATAAPRPFKRF
ncbi:MAG: thioesterase [Henriciella sp.]|uniref:PaaI family thioesterase n=1 Tax=Henriciella sp. TaxID=1968823 RepID=UPI000C0FA72C|nr:PaaI family thioesterase [Henriciella sp.]MAN74167.1 thioesterase [Henriciella sp.]MBF32754.1 thioesterase [Hyphomonadaceae bacterium]PHR76144.1 MAG: thioesterase [Henriciella sp.]